MNHSERAPEVELYPRLVVGDESHSLKSELQAHLQHRFLIVGDCSTAGGLIDAVASHRPDIALIELILPGGGDYAVKRVREVSPETAVVVWSADDHRPAVIAVIRAGAVCYCRKGLAFADLAERMGCAIDAHRTNSLPACLTG